MAPLPKRRVLRALGFRDPTLHARKSEFRWGAHIGSGTFGEVFQCTWLSPQPPFDVAVKVVPKSLVPDVQSQINLLNRFLCLRHPHVIKLLDWFQSRDHIYVVTELAKGGELFDHTIERGQFSDRQACQMLRDICSALEYIHSLGIVHRDLKPENLFVRGNGPYNPPLDLVMADFGVAAHIERPDGTLVSLKGVCGSPGYTAPEVYKKHAYGKPVDIWALGVLAFILLSGRFPFGHLSGASFLAEVEGGPIKFPKTLAISPAAEDFILGCLQLDPSKRWSALEALNHPWFAKLSSEDPCGQSTVSSSVDTVFTHCELPALAEPAEKKIEKIEVALPPASDVEDGGGQLSPNLVQPQHSTTVTEPPVEITVP